MTNDNMGLSKKRLFGTRRGSFDSCKLASLTVEECNKARKTKMKFKKAVKKRTKKINKVKSRRLRSKRLA